MSGVCVCKSEQWGEKDTLSTYGGDDLQYKSEVGYCP